MLNSRSQRSMSRRGQMLLMDALVFFLVLSLAASLPPLLLSQTDAAVDASEFSRMQDVAETALLVVLQSTIPEVAIPSDDGYALINNLRVDDGLVNWAMWMDENCSETGFGTFENELSLVVSGAMPLGFFGGLSVGTEHGTMWIGPVVPEACSVASAQQHFTSENIIISLLVWRFAS